MLIPLHIVNVSCNTVCMKLGAFLLCDMFILYYCSVYCTVCYSVFVELKDNNHVVVEHVYLQTNRRLPLCNW
jgi:hypothetical protein